MFNTTTVMPIDMDTRTMVNNRYLPSSGTARDVGGMISASSKKNTVNDTSMLLHRVTCKMTFVDQVFKERKRTKNKCAERV